MFQVSKGSYKEKSLFTRSHTEKTKAMSTNCTEREFFIGGAIIHWNNLLRGCYKNFPSLTFPQKVGADVFRSLPTWDTVILLTDL